MITREEVVWLYRCILGREPENADAVEANLKMYSCFAAARSAFLGSREFRLANWQAADGDVFYVPARRRPFEKLPNKIALTCIVKNEEARVSTMLTSALPLVDFVAFVDTGSEDETISTAEAILNKSGVAHAIAHVDFVDFAQARNAALALIPDRIEWVLSLDADEHLVQEDYQRLVDLADVDAVDAWNLPRYNFVDSEKKLAVAPYPDFQSRLFKNRKAICYYGAVHEVLINVNNWGVALINGSSPTAPPGGPHIHHMGQVGLTPERWLQKHHFYERLTASCSKK